MKCTPSHVNCFCFRSIFLNNFLLLLLFQAFCIREKVSAVGCGRSRPDISSSGGEASTTTASSVLNLARSDGSIGQRQAKVVGGSNALPGGKSSNDFSFNILKIFKYEF